MRKSLVLNKEQIQQKVDRLAWQIYEQNYKEKEIIIAGIAKRGVLVAQKLADKLIEISSVKIKFTSWLFFFKILESVIIPRRSNIPVFFNKN